MEKSSLSVRTSVDIRQSLYLAGTHLIEMLDPSRNYLPYWSLGVEPGDNAELYYSWPAHNLGRWWDAMLRLEDALGFPIPPEAESGMLSNLQLFFDNPDNICLAPPNTPGFSLELHSLREGMLALNALVRYWDNQWARDQGHVMIESLNRFIDFNKKISSLSRPFEHIIVFSLKLMEYFFGSPQITRFYKVVQSFPQCREDIRWILAPPCFQKRARVNAIDQAAIPPRPKTSASIFAKCFSLTSRKSATSLAVIFCW